MGMSSSQLTNSYFSRWLKPPTITNRNYIMVTYGLEWDGEWDGWPQLVAHLFTNRGLLLGIIPVNGMVYLSWLYHIFWQMTAREFLTPSEKILQLRCPVVISTGSGCRWKKEGFPLNFLQKTPFGGQKNGYNTSCSSSTCIHKFIFKSTSWRIFDDRFIDVYGSKISRVLQENTHH